MRNRRRLTVTRGCAVGAWLRNAVLCAVGFIAPVAVAAGGKTDSGAADELRRGAAVYQRFCSLCHGKNLEGQPDWRTRKADGRLPAPPHDARGHTWHHPDEVLFGIVKYGMVPPYAPDGYASDMPAWGSTLNDADIQAVLAYIKSRWPEEQRRYQEEVNQASKQSHK